MAPSGSVATSSATRACSARLYSTTGGQALRGVSELAPAQAVKKIVAAARAARGRVQHLAVNSIVTLQLVDPLGGAASALGRTAKVEDEQGEGEGCENKPHHLPRPWPGEGSDQQRAPHQRSPFVQSSTRAQTATAIPPSASAIKSQRSVSR